MTRSGLLLALVLGFAVGCSSAGPVTASRPSSPGPSPVPASTPTSSPSPGQTLMVVLEFSTGNLLAPDTIAIAGLDGYARAKAHFKARSVPWVKPDLGPLLPEVAHVAAGRAYYVDGDGVVRSLGVDGTVREETRFPVTSSQQEVSFAVSPDGHDLVGSVVTLPPEPSPEPTPGWEPSTPYSMDVMTATSGSAATLTYHTTWTYMDQWGSGAQFIGWDPTGPVATWPSVLGTQGGGPHQWNGSSLVHFTGGRPGAAVPVPQGGVLMDLLPSGDLLVSGPSPGFDVDGPDGRLLWHSAGAAADQTGIYGFLAPDTLHVVFLGSASVVYSPDSAPVNLPDGFFHSGWIDSRTLAGQVSSGNMAYLSLANPGEAVDLGYKGQFVGGLTT